MEDSGDCVEAAVTPRTPLLEFATARGRNLMGKPLADSVLAAVAGEIALLKAAGWVARLVSITVGQVEAIDRYVRNQKSKALKVGIHFEERNFLESITQEELEAALRALNVDPRVTGVILQRPVPRHISIRALQAAISPLKDVEGMHPVSIGNIVYNEIELAPCTALASVELLKSVGVPLAGLEVVVVGHSEIVGKPAAFLLMSQGATVTVCHHLTRSVAAHAREADALIVAVGKPKLISADMVKPGAVVIDIGINPVVDANGHSGIVGDVDYAAVLPVAGAITPVPGGVGPLTVAYLMRNTLTALRRQKHGYEMICEALPV